jgi:hypothetical protein
MTMTRPVYDVLVQQHDPSGQPGDLILHRLTVTYGDRLRGELEAHKAGLPALGAAYSQNHVTVWCWCALARLGLYGEKFQTFRNRDLVDIQAALDENGQPIQERLDPTRPDTTSGTPSTSPTPSAEAPAGGSTPTSTNG